MIAVVVYESIWGNTAILAKAIGQGLGMEARVMSTSEASPGSIDGADLLVLGAPVHSYNRPEYAAIQAGRDPEAESFEATPHPELVLMRDWIEELPSPAIPLAVFEICIWSLEGEGGAKAVVEALAASGHTLLVPAETFRMERLPITSGPGGWISPEELERARAWGATLREMVGSE